MFSKIVLKAKVPLYVKLLILLFPSECQLNIYIYQIITKKIEILPTPARQMMTRRQIFEAIMLKEV